MSSPKPKTYRQLERIVKGFANHRRIQIMELFREEPELSVNEISDSLDVHYKTIAEHIRRLAIAGLVIKRYQGRDVRHKLTPRGENILTFLSPEPQRVRGKNVRIKENNKRNLNYDSRYTTTIFNGEPMDTVVSNCLGSSLEGSGLMESS